MWMSEFKDAIRKIENMFLTACSVRGQQEYKAVRQEATTELYLLLHSDMAVKYFSAIYYRVGASGSQIGKKLEDYLSELWLEVCERYDPGKGALMSFLTTRMQNRIIDDERKMGGLVGLPRTRSEREKIHLLGIGCMDYREDSDEQSLNEIQINQDVFRMQKGRDESFEREHGILLAGDCLHALAKYIQSFTDAGTSLQSAGHRTEEPISTTTSTTCRKPSVKRYNRYFYYRIFYSSDILSYLKESGCTAAFQHAKEGMAAMHFSYTNFCTDRRIQYCRQEEITPFSILVRPLARNRDVLPRALLSTADRDARIAVPIQNEVIRGFMERIEGRKVSSSNISQMKRKYLDDIREILKDN